MSTYNHDNHDCRERVILEEYEKLSPDLIFEIIRHDSSESASVIPGWAKAGNQRKRAAIKVPTKFAERTIAQRRNSFIKFSIFGCFIKGSTVVMVFSVNSWSRPSITMRKPVV